MAADMDHLRAGMAELLRQEHPELCRSLEEAIRAGIDPEALLARIRAVNAELHGEGIIVGLVHAWLCTVDQDYRREVDSRPWFEGE